ncbi:hypothetical protein KFL_007510020 [Klebsormidium nitens]|uniref:Tudor domain-containing protein n=1 Tax=Klebsormidium nitens TaxID=105231 RepID=A0A1Y1IK51_KLENI|nr:hypothetical protein KFL_007510020 [Klebsormidium nitens]|eukprot:GAQ91245.1 hypothetical protein KFL_007510020 [Klebsormidium nitens]
MDRWIECSASKSWGVGAGKHGPGVQALPNHMAGGAAANDGPGQEVVGKPVRKKFGNKFFSGTVENYDPAEKWYKVTYEDGDTEEVDWAELSKLVANAEAKSPAKRKATPAKAPAAKKAKAVEAPAEKQTVGVKQVATGGPGQGRNVAKRVSVATPKAREAAAAAKKPVARAKKAAASKSSDVAAPEGQGRNVIGRRVRKKFEDIGAYYTGHVNGYDPKVAYYKVEYDDGDAEEMEWDELSMWLVDENGTEAGPSAPAAAASPGPSSGKKQVLEIRKRNRE